MKKALIPVAAGILLGVLWLAIDITAGSATTNPGTTQQLPEDVCNWALLPKPVTITVYEGAKKTAVIPDVTSWNACGGITNSGGSFIAPKNTFREYYVSDNQSMLVVETNGSHYRIFGPSSIPIYILTQPSPAVTSSHPA